MIPQRKEGSSSSHLNRSLSSSLPVEVMQFRNLGLSRRTRRMFGVGKVIIVFWTVGGGGLKVGWDIVGVGF